MPVTKPKFEAGKPTNWSSTASTDEKLAAGWEYVTLPAKNPVFSKEKYPTIRINDMGFQAGRTYLLPPQVAVTVKDRMARFHASQIRTLQPDQDVSAIIDLNTNGQNGTADFNPAGEQFAVAQ